MSVMETKSGLPGDANDEPLIDGMALGLFFLVVLLCFVCAKRRLSYDDAYQALSDDDYDERGCFAQRGNGSLVCCRCCGSLAAMFILSLAVWRGVTRNFHCNPADLAHVTAPYNGNILPRNISLVERKNFYQLTKWVDVYAEDGTYVGYFYDINLFFIMRFGFSDPNHRIWFEARYASWVSRLKPIIEYNVQRCDAGPGDAGAYFQIKENFWTESWFCIVHCTRIFDISKRFADVQIEEALLPPSDFGLHPEVHAGYYSTLVPTVKSSSEDPSYGFSWSFQHKWSLSLTDSESGNEIAAAKQHFVSGNQANNYRVISTWSVTAYPERALNFPSWVEGFMVALADIEEDAR